MSSLMQAVLQDVTPKFTSMTEEECLASFDMDASAIALVEGGWEPVDVGDHEDPSHDALTNEDFVLDGPAVYERNGYMIVRGERNDKAVWFAYEPINIGVH